jgi:hypothetical protein
MALEHRRRQMTLAAAAMLAALGGVTSAQAFTMNTLANSNGGTRYADPGDRIEDAAKGNTTTQDNSGLQLNFGGRSNRFGSSRDPVGAPPDQSRFNGR